jgi:hypothetical protein
MSASEHSSIPPFNMPKSTKKRKYNEISKDAPPIESRPKDRLSLNGLPTEITAMIYNDLDENSAVCLSLATKKLHADFFFFWPSPPKHFLDCMIMHETTANSIIINRDLWQLLKSWIGPNHHYNGTTNTFLNNKVFPSGSREELELEKRYKDYEISCEELPCPYEIEAREWEEMCQKVIDNDKMRDRSYTQWFEYWSDMEVFQRIRRERRFLTGNRAGGANCGRKWGKVRED